MANKILLDVDTITTSVTQSNSFVVVMGELEGTRRLPIVIGGAEAQSIVIAMEKMKPGRPLTHDMAKSVMDTFDIVLKEVVISRFYEGIFFSQLICERNGISEIIDSRTSDAIAMALRFNCPIYTYAPIMDAAGVEMNILEEDEEPQESAVLDYENPDEKKMPDQVSYSEAELSAISLDDLEKMLMVALEREEYEKAAKIRDEIDHRKS